MNTLEDDRQTLTKAQTPCSLLFLGGGQWLPHMSQALAENKGDAILLHRVTSRFDDHKKLLADSKKLTG